MYKVQSAGHPNIIEIYAVNKIQQFYIDDSQSTQCVIIMEYFPYNLQERIALLNYNNSSQANLAQALYQLTDALEFLQQLGYCHCDIKPSNILINSLENPQIFKICDLDKLNRYQD